MSRRAEQTFQLNFQNPQHGQMAAAKNRNMYRSLALHCVNRFVNKIKYLTAHVEARQ
jgi:hypothetical protein